MLITALAFFAVTFVTIVDGGLVQSKNVIEAPKNDTFCPLNYFPFELVLEIASHLDAASIQSLSSVNSHFHKMDLMSALLNKHSEFASIILKRPLLSLTAAQRLVQWQQTFPLLSTSTLLQRIKNGNDYIDPLIQHISKELQSYPNQILVSLLLSVVFGKLTIADYLIRNSQNPEKLAQFALIFAIVAHDSYLAQCLLQNHIKNDLLLSSIKLMPLFRIVRPKAKHVLQLLTGLKSENQENLNNIIFLNEAMKATVVASIAFSTKREVLNIIDKYWNLTFAGLSIFSYLALFKRTKLINKNANLLNEDYASHAVVFPVALDDRKKLKSLVKKSKNVLHAAFLAASILGHVDLLKWLLTHYENILSQRTILGGKQSAENFGNEPCVEYLNEYILMKGNATFSELDV